MPNTYFTIYVSSIQNNAFEYFIDYTFLFISEKLLEN